VGARSLGSPIGLVPKLPQYLPIRFVLSFHFAEIVAILDR
jgi:hypothetical protein